MPCFKMYSINILQFLFDISQKIYEILHIFALMNNPVYMTQSSVVNSNLNLNTNFLLGSLSMPCSEYPNEITKSRFVLKDKI